MRAMFPGAKRAAGALCIAAMLWTAGPACVDVAEEMEITSTAGDWRDEVIYQVMIDRFEDGDVNNNYNVEYLREASYHGGDWQGLIDRLDYLEALGVTALWISPVIKNVEEDAGFASYHGYWTQDFLDVNPHFGTLTDLQKLSRAAHKRGMKVILDVVTNHVGQLFFYDINRNGRPDDVLFGAGGPGPGSFNQDLESSLRRSSEWDPDYDSRGVQGFTSLGENGLAPIEWLEAPEINRFPPWPPEFHDDTWYNRKGRVTVWGSSTPQSFEYVREQEMLGDFPGGLKDLATSKREVQDALIRVFQHWIEVADFDGFRIDTLKHQDPAFFARFAPAIRAHARSIGKKNFFMFGEAFDGNDELLGRYTQGEGVDSVFYFSAKYQVFDDVFGRGQVTDQVRRLFEARSNLADGIAGDDPTLPRYSTTPKTNGPVDGDGNALVPSQLLVHFLDNHDVPRYLYSFPDLAKLHTALTYLLTFDGIPCIYYGTEQALRGGPDPSNREDMWHSGFRTDGETYRLTQKLIRLRKDLAPLRRGDVAFRCTTTDGPGILAFERHYNGESVLVVINTSDEASKTTDVCTGQAGAAMQTGFSPGATLRDHLFGTTVPPVGADGTLTVSVPARGAMILAL